MSKTETLFKRCSTVYLCLMTVFVLAREVIPLQFIVEKTVFSLGMFGIGALLILWECLIKKTVFHLFAEKSFWVFLGVAAVSVLLNFRYSFVSNIKAFCWMGIYLFFVYYCGFRKTVNRKAFFITSFVTIGVFVVLSLPTYYFSVEYGIANESIITGVSNQGFVADFGRLWGIFSDPNSAGIYTVVAMTMGVWLFVKTKHIFARIVIVLTEILMFSFAVLTASRTVMVLWVCTAVVLGFLLAWNFFFKQKGKRFWMAVVSCFLSGLTALGLLMGVRFCLPYVKSGFVTVMSDHTWFYGHKFYDDFYEKTQVEVLYGYLESDDIESFKIAKPSKKVKELVRKDMEESQDLSNGRFEIWGNALKIFSRRPLFGTSPRGTVDYALEYMPKGKIAEAQCAMHNSWLQLLVGVGLAGLLTALYFLAKSVCHFFRSMGRKPVCMGRIVDVLVLVELVSASMLLSDLYFFLTFGGIAFWYFLGQLNRKTDRVLHTCRQPDNVKRILIYGPKDPAGGVENVVYRYVRAMHERYPEMQFDLILYGRDFSMEQAFGEVGCRCVYLPSRNRHYFKYKAALENLFSEHSYVAVWGNYSGLTNIDLLRLGESYGVPVRVAHSHGSKLYWGSAVMKYVVFVLHYFNKMGLRLFATDYWACSDVSGAFMFPKSLQDRVQIVPNALDLAPYRLDLSCRAQMREQLGIAEDCKVVGHVARLCEVKNQDFLLETFAALLKLEPNAVLLMIGDGERKDELLQKAETLGITPSVRFLGNRTDVPQLLQAVDVFVLCSFSEGLSLSAVEAQAAGVPCVLPTTVSAKTAVGGAVTFVPLESGAEVWAEKLLSAANSEKRDTARAVAESGYEIGAAADRMAQAFSGNF